jgi:hypothetical protein
MAMNRIGGIDEIRKKKGKGDMIKKGLTSGAIAG